MSRMYGRILQMIHKVYLPGEDPSSNLMNPMYICTDCKKLSSTEDDLDAHNTTHSTSKSTLRIEHLKTSYFLK